jgi:uncharacterized protein (TIGR01777 family)
MKKTILLAGGTGQIGVALQSKLVQEGHNVRILTRRPKKENSNEFYWNPKKQEIDSDCLKGVQVIINLCGANVGEKRWTKSRKIELLNSRIQPTEFLYSLVKKVPNLESYITASGITCYGYQNTMIAYNEDNPYGTDFLSELVENWEKSADLFEDYCPVIKMRTAVVFEKNKGAFPKIAKPIEMGIGSPLGSGDQMISWVHIDDIVNAYLFFVNQPTAGAYNIVGGNETNKVFLQTLATYLKKGFWIPKVPKFIIRILFGQMADLVLEGVKVSNQKITDLGFVFEYTQLDKLFDKIYKDKIDKII